MKKVISKVFSIIIMTMMLFGCASEGDKAIDLVKGGVLKLDTSTTVGQVFEGCDYLTDQKWTYFKTKQGRKVVQFDAIITPMDKAVKESYKGMSFSKPKTLDAFIAKHNITYGVIIQFILKGEKDFNVAYQAFNINTPAEIKNMFNDFDKNYYFVHKSYGLIKSIYKNQFVVPRPNSLASIEYEYRKKTKKKS